MRFDSERDPSARKRVQFIATRAILQARPESHEEAIAAFLRILRILSTGRPIQTV